MSVDLEQLLSEEGLPKDHKVPKNFGAVALKVASIRSLELKVGSDPVPDNQFHGQIWGVRTKNLKQKIRTIIDGWVKSIDGVELN